MRRAVTLIVVHACATVAHAGLPFRVLCRGVFVVSRLRCLKPVRRHVLEARSGKHVIAAECGNGRSKQPDQGSPTRSRRPLRNGGGRVRAAPASSKAQSIST
jgi:hypothetical protein